MDQNERRKFSRRKMLAVLVAGGGLAAAGGIFESSRGSNNSLGNRLALSSGSGELAAKPLSLNVLLDGGLADRYFGLDCATSIRAGSTLGDGSSVVEETLVVVCRRGTSEGSVSPFESGDIVCAILPGGPDKPVVSMVTALTPPAGMDVRQPGVTFLEDGRLCLSAGFRPSTSSKLVQGGSVVVYSSDGGRTWTTPADSDYPNRSGRLGLVNDIASPNGVVEVAKGVVLCGWQGRVLENDLYESAGYFIGRYQTGKRIYWLSQVIVASGERLRFKAAEPALVVLPDGTWLFFVRNGSDEGVEYLFRSVNRGRAWTGPTTISTREGEVVYGGVHPVLLSSGTVGAFGRRTAHAGEEPGALMWTTDAGQTWQGPVDVAIKAQSSVFDYGSVVQSSSDPDQLWVTFSTALGTNTADVVGVSIPLPKELK